jgi:hypothetical protein
MPKHPRTREVDDDIQINELLAKSPLLPPPPECYQRGWCYPLSNGWWNFDATQDATIEQRKLWMAEVRAWRRACLAILVQIQMPEHQTVQ